MSSKYRTLAALSGTVPVPALFALEEAQLAGLWCNFEAVRGQVRAVLDNIRLTAGAFLDRHLDQLDAIEPLQWAADADARLAALLSAAGLSLADALAVRSSGGIEDGAAHSFAGIFESVLGVHGLPALRDAVARVWRSGLSRRAVIERLRCGLLDAPVDMTVIVQKMVAARWAGVAFSHDPITAAPGLLVEAVPGLGDALVSGAATSLSVRCAATGFMGDAPLLAQPGMLAALAAAVRLIEQQLATAVDVEWAFDGNQVWVLQARPVTSLRTVRPAAGDDAAATAAQWLDLYLAPDEDIATLRPLPGFANYFRTKRRPLALLAHAHGVPAGTALLVRASQAGLAQPDRMDALCARFHGPEVVLDFSDHLRQQVLPLTALAPRLRQVLGAQPASFVIRDYTRGDWGLITQPMDSEGGDVFCECSADGLLAINRGSADTCSFAIDVHHRASGEAAGAAMPFTASQLRQLHRVTREAVGQLGQVQLEWVLAGGRLCLIDFSPLRSLHLTPGELGADGQRTISPGFAHGRALCVADDGALEDISIAATVSISHMPSADSLGPVVARLAERARAGGGSMIVVAPRPYAALAALIPYVGGFVFEQSSLLCHLAILLRESQLPAVASRALYGQAREGQALTIEARGAEAVA